MRPAQAMGSVGDGPQGLAGQEAGPALVPPAEAAPAVASEPEVSKYGPASQTLAAAMYIYVAPLID